MNRTNLHFARTSEQETIPNLSKRDSKKKTTTYHSNPLLIDYRSILIKQIPQTSVSYSQKSHKQAAKPNEIVYFDFGKYLTFSTNSEIKQEKQIQNEMLRSKQISEACNEIKIAKQQDLKIRNKKKGIILDSEDYVPNESSSQEQSFKQLPQTKNIIKNFGKSIYTFIIKEKALTFRLLQQENINQIDFFNNLSRYKDNLATIYGLRSFWCGESNPYAKQIRILSSIFLRKYCLGHVFNSRVQNYHRNIKYRYKIMKSLSNPNGFTHIKQY